MRAGLLAAAGVAAIALSGAAQSEAAAQATTAAPVPGGGVTNLREALVKTYGTNPTIMAERQSLRQSDEDVALADRGVTRLAIGRVVAGAFGMTVYADAAAAILPGFEKPRGFSF